MTKFEQQQNRIFASAKKAAIVLGIIFAGIGVYLISDNIVEARQEWKAHRVHKIDSTPRQNDATAKTAAGAGTALLGLTAIGVALLAKRQGLQK